MFGLSVEVVVEDCERRQQNKMKPNLKDLEIILNNYHEPTIQTLDKALHWLETFKTTLKNLALDEPPFKGQYNGWEMLAIHAFIDKEILEGDEKR